jgi:ribonuclease H / adenosylcobalamin/alpha-ribazole phosphatase
MTTRFILVRHGETNSSKERRFAGVTDTPLSDVGLEQAAALGKRLRAVRIDVMHVSPLQRCQQTAAAVTETTGRKATLVEDLRECHFGDWEDLTINEVLEKWPDDLQKWANDDTVPPPGGECWADLGERVERWFHAAMERYENRTVLAVTHGGAIIAIARRILGVPREAMDAFLVETGSLSMVHVNHGRKRIRLWNDITHQRDPLMETTALPGYGPARPPTTARS